MVVVKVTEQTPVVTFAGVKRCAVNIADCTLVDGFGAVAGNQRTVATVSNRETAYGHTAEQSAGSANVQ